MKNKSIDRAYNVANYIINNNATTREASKVFNISRQTVCNDISKIESLNKDLYNEVRVVIENNFNRKHYRGGYTPKKNHY